MTNTLGVSLSELTEAIIIINIFTKQYYECTCTTYVYMYLHYYSNHSKRLGTMVVNWH